MFEMGLTSQKKSEMFEIGLSYSKSLKCFNWAKLSQNALNFVNELNFPKKSEMSKSYPKKKKK